MKSVSHQKKAREGETEAVREPRPQRHTQSSENWRSVAVLAKGLSDENRLRILLCMVPSRKSVSKIVEEVGLSQPLVSHHLKELKRCLLVDIEREGPFIYYSLSDSQVIDMVNMLGAVAANLVASRKSLWSERRLHADMSQITKLIDRMDPETALEAIGGALKTIFPVVSEEARGRFLLQLVGESQADKVSSMVHLWLAECMGEGVDPTQMCQSLVDKVAQSKQLTAITNPEILVLFEDWLEELEEEVVRLAANRANLRAEDLAADLGLSSRGAVFLIAKLKREGKLPWTEVEL